MKKFLALLMTVLLAISCFCTASAAGNKTLENFEGYGGKGAAMARKWKTLQGGDPVTMQLVSDGGGGHKGKMSWKANPGNIGWGGVYYAVNGDWSAYTAIRITFSGLADTNHAVVVQYTCLQADGLSTVPFNYEVHVTDDGRGDWPLLQDGTLTLPLDKFVKPAAAEGVKDMKNIAWLTLSVLTDRGQSFCFDDVVLIDKNGDAAPITTTAPKPSDKTTSAPFVTGGTTTAPTTADALLVDGGVVHRFDGGVIGGGVRPDGITGG